MRIKTADNDTLNAGLEMGEEKADLKFNNLHETGSNTHKMNPEVLVKTRTIKWSRVATVLPIAYIIWWMMTLPATVVPLLRAAIYEGTLIPWPLNIGTALFLSVGLPSLILASVFVLICLDM